MKPRGQNGRSGHDRWLVSYADFVTLLFAFFVTMYAISKVDATKLEPASNSLQLAFNASDSTPPLQYAPGPPKLVAPPQVVPSAPTLDDISIRLTANLADLVKEGRVDVTQDARGLVVSLPEAATFDIASAEVTSRAQKLIAQVAAALSDVPNALRIEGHTDDVPIRTTQYGSNWELSTARASAVVVFLIKTVGITPDRLSAAGYGEFHPRAENTSPADRARNRRIDIVVLDAPVRPALRVAK